ncbi:MAG: HlyD family secretion protein [Pseudomonadota bacterium]|nr:HlyD family secretion protein [Pseudomonadota bacterium]
MIFVILVAIFYFTGGRVMSTDDAYIQAARVNISSDIGGRVAKLFVHDNETVHRGEPLFELDNRKQVIAIQYAKARLAEARLRIEALKSTYLQRKAQTLAALAKLNYQTHEFNRQMRLESRGISSRAKLDLARQALASARQKLEAAKQSEKNVQTLLDNNPDIPVENHPAVQQAQARLEQAKLDLSHTLIKAPMSGIVSKVDTLQPGDHIEAASPVFSLTATQHAWIEANFKETELTYMRPGQKATIDIDAYPEHTFHGTVQSLSSGTGSSFSLLPPENATGNWVKVVQRLPVRISIDDAGPSWPLHSGLSVVVNVDTHHSRLDNFWK